MKKFKIINIVLSILSPLFFLLVMFLLEKIGGYQELSQLNAGHWILCSSLGIVTIFLWIGYFLANISRDDAIHLFFVFLKILLHGGLFAGGICLLTLCKIDYKTNLGLFWFVNILGIYSICFGTSIIMNMCFSDDSNLGVFPIIIFCLIYLWVNETQGFGFYNIGIMLKDRGILTDGTALSVFQFLLPAWLPISVIISCIVKKHNDAPDWVLYIIYLVAPVAVLIIPIIIIICGVTGIFVGAAINDDVVYTYTINGVKAKKIGNGEFEDINGNKYSGIDESSIIKK